MLARMQCLQGCLTSGVDVSFSLLELLSFGKTQSYPEHIHPRPWTLIQTFVHWYLISRPLCYRFQQLKLPQLCSHSLGSRSLNCSTETVLQWARWPWGSPLSFFSLSNQLCPAYRPWCSPIESENHHLISPVVYSGRTSNGQCLAYFMLYSIWMQNKSRPPLHFYHVVLSMHVGSRASWCLIKCP